MTKAMMTQKSLLSEQPMTGQLPGTGLIEIGYGLMNLPASAHIYSYGDPSMDTSQILLTDSAWDTYFTYDVHTFPRQCLAFPRPWLGTKMCRLSVSPFPTPLARRGP